MFKKGDNVICRNVPGLVVSYDKDLDCYKVKAIGNEAIMPFVYSEEMRLAPKKETSNLTESIPLDNSVLDKVIGVEEASRLLGLSAGTVKNMCASDKLPSKKIGNTWVIDKTKLSKSSK